MIALNERLAWYTKVLPDGRVIDVYPLITGTAQITISRSIESGAWDDGW